MSEAVGRILIISDFRDQPRQWEAVAERLGFWTRILHHTLDLEFVLRHWRPDIVVLQLPMPDRQDTLVLQRLRAIAPVRLVLVTDIEEQREAAARDVGGTAVAVTSIAATASSAEIEQTLRELCNLERAA